MTNSSWAPALFIKRVFNKIGRPYGINPFPRAFQNPLATSAEQRSSVFNKVYENNFWGSIQSRSGLGSELEFTANYRLELSALIRERSIKTIFDAPCGDLNWMQKFLKDNQINYIGGDISKSLVKLLKQQFPERDIRYFDICIDRFPTVQLWHCRDCLFHLPFADIRKALDNFVASDIPFVLFTTHRARFLHKNLDVTIGGFRFLDLHYPPFNFPPAIRYLKDYKKRIDFPRFVGLWGRDDVASILKQWSINEQH